MREILFRGKRIDNGIWLEGDLRHWSSGGVGIGNNGLRRTFEVIPETVGQHTGLNDRYGKRIFEGDIVDCWSEGVNAKGSVQQRKDGLWIIYPNWQKKIMWGLCPDEYCHTTVEVIGNIYDNPELIGGSEDEQG